MKLSVLKIEKIIDNENIVIYPVLLQTEKGNFLVDCGYQETFNELQVELKSKGIEVKDLTGVIITHDDYDHLGGLHTLKQLNPALKIYCGIDEKDSVSGKIKSERLLQAEASLLSIPDEYKAWALNFINKLKSVQRYEVYTTFEDQECFEKDILILHTPGHTKGHISLYHIHEKTLIAGDALVIENRELNIANPQFTLNLPLALKSVEKIKNFKPQNIICYHGGIMDKNINCELDRLLTTYSNKAQQNSNAMVR